MNAIHGHWDERMHRWEHNVAVAAHNLIHNEAFWAALIVSLILISMILLAVLTRNTGDIVPRPMMHPSPFGPYYPYY